MNQPFGSRIMTPSGILLNSQILDFSWPNKSQSFVPPNPVSEVNFSLYDIKCIYGSINKHLLSRQYATDTLFIIRHLFYYSSLTRLCVVCARLQHNSVQPGKRPLSFLMPTAVRPSLGVCGTYVALGSSNGDRALSGITQVQQLHYAL